MDERRGLKIVTRDDGAYFCKVKEGKTLEGITPSRSWLTCELVFPDSPSGNKFKDAAIVEIKKLRHRQLDITVYAYVGNKSNPITWRQVKAANGKYMLVKYEKQSGSLTMNWAEQGKTRQEKRKAEAPAEIKQRADAATRQRPELETVRKAELEGKGLPYYPPPRTLEAGHNAEHWHQLLRDNPQNARIYNQATAALSALKEEGIPFLLDYLSSQTTPKSRYDALRLIQVEYLHRNDLHKLLPCLEQQSMNYQSTRLLALEGLEKRAKDLKKDLVPKIESLAEDMLNNPRLSKKTQEEIGSRLKTIRLEANSPAANGQH